MFEVSVNVSGQEFSDLAAGLKSAPEGISKGISQSGPLVSKEVRDGLNKVFRELEARHSKAWSWGSQSDSLHKRSGAGLASIKRSIAVRGGSLDSIIGSISTGTMGIHETGGTITPKRSKYLAIPLQAALSSKGIPLRNRPRDWNGGFVFRSKKGNLIIGRRKVGEGIEPLYVLKKSVTIKSRLGLNDAMEKGYPQMEAKIATALMKSMGV
jgi:hypothetical protein